MTPPPSASAGISRRSALQALAACVAPGLIAGCAAEPAQSAPPDRHVTVMLDGAPRSDHTGLYAAIALGLVADAGLTVTVRRRGTVRPESLLVHGTTDLAFTDPVRLARARARGLDVVQVLAALRHGTRVMAVRASRRRLRSPGDLDGLVRADYGDVAERAGLPTALHADGGRTGTCTTTRPQVPPHEALYQGLADFAVPTVHWQGVQATLAGRRLRTFDLTDHGVPDHPGTVLAAGTAAAARRPDVIAAFVQAVALGYEYASEHPERAAELLVAAAPADLPNFGLVRLSHLMLAERGWLVDAQGVAGRADPVAWQAYGRLLHREGLLVDTHGVPLVVEPAWHTHWTDTYLTTAPTTGSTTSTTGPGTSPTR